MWLVRRRRKKTPRAILFRFDHSRAASHNEYLLCRLARMVTRTGVGRRARSLPFAILYLAVVRVFSDRSVALSVRFSCANVSLVVANGISHASESRIRASFRACLVRPRRGVSDSPLSVGRPKNSRRYRWISAALASALLVFATELTPVELTCWDDNIVVVKRPR